MVNSMKFVYKLCGAGSSDLSVSAVSSFTGKGESSEAWKADFKYKIGSKIVAYDYIIE